MSRNAVILAVLVGCGGPPTLPALAPPPVDVQLRVVQPKVAAGEPVTVEVEVWRTDGWTLQVPQPMSEGLTVSAKGVDGPVVVADRTRLTATFELAGEDGSYVIGIPSFEATGPGDQTRTLEPARLFVDIGVSGPQVGQLAEVAEVPPEPPLDVRWIAAGVLGALALVAFVGWLVWRVVRPKPPPPPVPADVAARTAWEQARASDLDDHALALALSEILRTFLQEVTGFPAMSRTSSEIIRWAHSSDLLDDHLRSQARRVLEATDRLKFAREGGGTGFFDALETDFLAVVAALTVSRSDDAPEADDLDEGDADA